MQIQKRFWKREILRDPELQAMKKYKGTGKNKKMKSLKGKIAKGGGSNQQNNYVTLSTPFIQKEKWDINKTNEWMNESSSYLTQATDAHI